MTCFDFLHAVSDQQIRRYLEGERGETGSPLNRPAFLAAISAVFGLWCLGCCLSSKCCGLWGRSGQIERDRRLAQLLQNEALHRPMSRAERALVAEEHQRRAAIRREFVEKHLQSSLFVDNTLSCDMETQKQCYICLTEYQEGDKIAHASTKLCKHTFHRECVCDWLVRKKFCPLCRRIFMAEDLRGSCNEDDEVSDDGRPEPVLEDLTHNEGDNQAISTSRIDAIEDEEEARSQLPEQQAMDDETSGLDISSSSV